MLHIFNYFDLFIIIHLSSIDFYDFIGLLIMFSFRVKVYLILVAFIRTINELILVILLYFSVSSSSFQVYALNCLFLSITIIRAHFYRQPS